MNVFYARTGNGKAIPEHDAGAYDGVILAEGVTFYKDDYPTGFLEGLMKQVTEKCQEGIGVFRFSSPLDTGFHQPLSFPDKAGLFLFSKKRVLETRGEGTGPFGPMRNLGHLMDAFPVERMTEVFTEPDMWIQLVSSRAMYPKILGLLNYGYCNRRCFMCCFHSRIVDAPYAIYKETDHRKRALPLDAVLSILSEAASYPDRPSFYVSSFGEFFLDPNWEKILTMIKKDEFPVSLLTNGTVSDRQIDVLIDLGIEELVFSLHATSEKSYREIFGDEADLASSLSTMERFRARKSAEQILSANFLVFDDDNRRFSSIVGFFRGRVNRVYTFLRNEKLHYEHFFIVPPSASFCISPFKYIFIMPNGFFSPCCGVNEMAQYEKMEWLVHCNESTILSAFKYYQDLYRDRTSPLRSICKRCDYWVYEHYTRSRNYGDYDLIESANMRVVNYR